MPGEKGRWPPNRAWTPQGSIAEREEFPLEESDRVHALFRRVGRSESLERPPLAGRGVEHLVDDGHAPFAERLADAIAPVDQLLVRGGSQTQRAAR